MPNPATVNTRQLCVGVNTRHFAKGAVLAVGSSRWTSLFGGRGGVIGSIFGAVLVQTTSNGLVMLNANPYLYPLVNSVIIFVAAWVDGRRRILTERLEQRKIRVEA
jgi:predicted ABC-type sugar transport system permease subunit